MKNLLLALLLAIASPAWATTIYACGCATGADNKCVPGSDSNDGLSDTAPKLTLAAAIAATGGSARVLNLCTGGRWSDSATTLSVAITIGAYSPNTCKEGCRLRKPMIAETRSGQDALTITAAGVTLRDISVQGGDTGRTGVTSSGNTLIMERVTIAGFDATGYTCTAGTGVQINQSEISRNATGVLSGCSDITLDRNKLDNNGSAACVESPGSCADNHAVVLNGPFVTGRGVVVRNNTITRTANLSGGACASPVLVARGRIKGLVIEGNEITETAPTAACWGVSLEDGFGSGSGVEGFPGAVIRGNRIVNVGGIGIGVSSCQSCNIENNIIVRSSELGGTPAGIDFTAIAAPGKATGSGDTTNTAATVRNNSIYMHAGTAASRAIAVTSEGTAHVITSNLIDLAGSNATTKCFDTTGLASAAFAVVDHNLCHLDIGYPRWSQEHLTIIEARGSAAQWDYHGLWQAPKLLASPTSGTRHAMAVNAGSPVVNAADAVRSARLAYRGYPAVAGRDIGAEEFNAQGTTYFVSTSGSNGNDGLTIGTPFRNVQYAMNLVNPGDTIEVRAGTYTETLMASRPGSSIARITLRGYNGEMPVIRRTGVGPTLWFYHSLCDEEVIGTGTGNTDCQAMYWTVSGLEIQGSATGGGDGNAIKIDTPKVRIQGNKICCTTADMVKIVRTANDVEILDNEVWQNAAITTPTINAQGVDAVGSDRLRVAGNYLHDIPDIGMYCKGNCRNAVFENNRFERIGTTAMMMGQSTDADRMVDGPYEIYDSVMRNNVVAGAGWACFAISSAYNVKALNNSCFNTGQTTHGSVLLSNEAEVSQGSVNIEIANNIIYGSTARPIITYINGAMDDTYTLDIHDNIYWTSDSTPRFSPNSDTGAQISLSAWVTAYADLSGKTDNSRAIAPNFERLTGPMSLSLAPGSPAINTGVSHASVARDYRWVTRPQGPRMDVGAFEFTLERLAMTDTTHPTVYSANPASAAINVLTTATMQVTFSEAIDCATVTAGTFTISSGVSGAVACDGSTASLTPSAALTYGTAYTVTLSTDIADIAGNSLSGVRSWTFTTIAAPATGYTFTFLAYGDNRGGTTCTSNGVHIGLVSLMAAESAAEMVFNLGDMVAGLDDSTNWVQRGPRCPDNANHGSLKEQIAPLQDKPAVGGLPMFYFPVIGNHDDGWGSGWYPDHFGNGFCDVFNSSQLFSNHTGKPYFQDQSVYTTRYSDASFFSLMCSTNTADAYKVYPTYGYYSFNHRNSHFTVLRVNSDYYDLMACSSCLGNEANYQDYYYIHQLHWLKQDLAAAQANPAIQNIFVFLHAPLLTTSYGHAANASWPTLRKEFSKYSKLKIAFSGHNHVYERSYPVRTDDANPTGVRDDANGVVYTITGGGGSFLDGFSGSNPLIPVRASTYHYLRVNVDGSSITVNAINSGGTVMDTYTR